MDVRFLKRFSIIFLLLCLSLIIGCAGIDLSPKKGVLFYHQELIDADKAIEAAQQAGKDRECPKLFSDAAKMRDKAYEVYLSCRTEEGRALARKATEMAKKLCAKVSFVTLKVNFDYDKSVVKEKYYPEIQQFADYLKGNRATTVEIQGHTDNIASHEYNQRLSLRRAEAVRNILVEKYGINRNRLTVKGFGKTKPVATNETEEGRALNRRIEAVIVSGK